MNEAGVGPNVKLESGYGSADDFVGGMITPISAQPEYVGIEKRIIEIADAFFAAAKSACPFPDGRLNYKDALELAIKAWIGVHVHA